MKKQFGGTIVGLIIGVVIGLGAALAVAVYVTKVPVPFLNKGQSRTADHDEAEARKNKDWDPNAPLYGKNPAKPSAVAPAAAAPDAGLFSVPTPAAAPASRPQVAAAPAVKAAPAKAASAASAADPLGDLAKARSAAATGAVTSAATGATTGAAPGGADPFSYFVQVGAYRTSEDAEAQRVKLSLTGVETKITEREQSGRTVFRVRAGPFNKKDDADKMKERLDATGLETALVRVQR